MRTVDRPCVSLHVGVCLRALLLRARVVNAQLRAHAAQIRRCARCMPLWICCVLLFTLYAPRCVWGGGGGASLQHAKQYIFVHAAAVPVCAAHRANTVSRCLLHERHDGAAARACVLKLAHVQTCAARAKTARLIDSCATSLVPRSNAVTPCCAWPNLQLFSPRFSFVHQGALFVLIARLRLSCSRSYDRARDEWNRAPKSGVCFPLRSGTSPR